MSKHRPCKIYKGFLIPSMFDKSNHVFLECTKRGRLTNSALEKAVNYYYAIDGDDSNITRDYIRQRIKESMRPCIMERILDGRVRCVYSKINSFDTFSASNILILTKLNPSLKVKPLIIGETQKDGVYVNLGKKSKVFNNNLQACIEHVILCLCRDDTVKMQLTPQSENKRPSRTDFVVNSVKKIIGEI